MVRNGKVVVRAADHFVAVPAGSTSVREGWTIVAANLGGPLELPVLGGPRPFARASDGPPVPARANHVAPLFFKRKISVPQRPARPCTFRVRRRKSKKVGPYHFDGRRARGLAGQPQHPPAGSLCSVLVSFGSRRHDTQTAQEISAGITIRRLTDAFTTRAWKAPRLRPRHTNPTCATAHVTAP